MSHGYICKGHELYHLNSTNSRVYSMCTALVCLLYACCVLYVHTASVCLSCVYLYQSRASSSIFHELTFVPYARATTVCLARAYIQYMHMDMQYIQKFMDIQYIQKYMDEMQYIKYMFVSLRAMHTRIYGYAIHTKLYGYTIHTKKYGCALYRIHV